MVYRILADIVVVAHLSFIIFVVLGGVLAFRWRRAIWLHVPAAVWGVLIQCVGWTCPLTPLENWLRSLGGEKGYDESFIEHYLVSILYPDRLTRGFQMVLGLFVLAVNLLIYWRVLSRMRRQK